MAWEPRRWATYPRERLMELVKGIEAAGHEVKKLSAGKPIVDTLSDEELELAACAARPGRVPEVPGFSSFPPEPPLPKKEPEPEPKKKPKRKKPTRKRATRKPRKKKGGDDK